MSTLIRSRMRSARFTRQPAPIRPASGVSLVELMIGMVIGLVVAFGIFTMFNGVSRSNQLQSGLARLQESGRFAVTQIEKDLRMTSAQYCSVYSGNAHSGTLRPMWSSRSPLVYAANLGLHDSGGMQSVSATTGARVITPATASYPLSSRFFMQGYSCTTGTTCTPALPVTGMFPAAGLVVNQRVPQTDILTVRYQRGSGWPISGANNCISGGTLQVAPQTGDDPLNFAAGNLVMISDCQNPSILPITGVAGNTLNLGALLPSGVPPICNAQGNRDVRVFNFSEDFVTVTYYLAFRADDNPDATPNAGGNRLVPTLIRRENNVEQELVRGVDDLRFRYGVLDRAGALRFLTAAQVDNRLSDAINCPLKPDGVAPSPTVATAMEPGCLWRSVSRIEAHLLVNSESDVGVLDTVSRSFRFMGVDYTPTATTALTTGVLAANKPRREFIAQATARNTNP